MRPVPMEMSAKGPEVRMLLQGESGLVVDFGDSMDETINASVRTLATLLAESAVEGIFELVPTCRSLLVCFDPLVTDRRALARSVSKHLPAVASFEGPVQLQSRVINVPVCYGGEHGPDLQHVADHCGLTVEDVVTAHCSPLYLVYMLGFTPGFPYLGGMSERIATPRLAVPRMEIPAGSVGIADRQTGIYPIASPGGWRIIGRTPLRLFDPSVERPFLFDAGDRVRFAPIGEPAYLDISRQLSEGTYRPLVETQVFGDR